MIFLVVIGCQNTPPQSHKHNNPNGYLRMVGDTEFNPKTDDPNFKICHHDLVVQYYGLGKTINYLGEKPALVKVFTDNCKMEKLKGETGFVTIRFIVNCQGQTGWFRLSQVNEKLEEITLDKRITDQLLKLTKSLNGWQIGQYNNSVYDYYQYLTFKIIDGQLTDILP